MNNLLKAPWFLILCALPLLIMELSGLSFWLTLKDALQDQSRYYYAYGAVLSLLVAATWGYGLSLWRRKEEFGLFASYLTLAVLLVFDFLLLFDYRHFYPSWQDRWMLSEVDILYHWLPLLPATFYPLLAIVIHHARASFSKYWKISTGLIIGVPVFWYIFFIFLLPLLKHAFNHNAREHLITVLAFVSITLFAYGVLYIIYLLFRKVADKSREKYEKLGHITTVFRFLYALIAPPLCFVAYNHLFSGNNGPLGTLEGFLWPIVAFVNGLLLVIPPQKNNALRAALFLGKLAILPMVIYFTLILAPFLPLAPIAIIIYGVGLLMLAPPILLFIQTWSIREDYRFFQEKFSQSSLRNTMVAGAAIFLFAPGYLLADFYTDKIMLRKMIEATWFYNHNSPQEEIASPEASNQLFSRIWSIKRTWLRGKNRPESFVNQPIISSLYSRIVMNSLTISDARMARLEQIYLGERFTRVSRPRPLVDPIPEISSVRVKSRLSKDKSHIISQVDLQIKNPQNTNNLEFHTEFELPQLAWVSNYYLFVGKQKKEGLLTDKKSALWIYNQIVRSSRDPGILYYKKPGLVGFHVFPFEARQKRKTGFEITHREPFVLKMNGHKLPLGYDLSIKKVKEPLAFAGQNARHISYYLPKEYKSTLPLVQRTPYLHFLIDTSAAATPEAMQKQLERLDRFLKQEWITLNQKRVSSFQYQVSLVNDRVLTFTQEEFTQRRKHLAPGSKGFFLEKAFKIELGRQWEKGEERYPVFIVISENPGDAVTFSSFTGLRQLFPEGGRYYTLAANGDLHQSSLGQKPGADSRAFRNIQTPLVRLFQTKESKIFLPDTAQDELALSPAKANPGSLKTLETKNRLQAGAAINALYSEALLYPQPASELRVIQKSFESRMMSPLTSFIVLENETQEKLLLRKQKKMLASKNIFDAGEETAMSEPELLALLILSAIIALWIKRRHSSRRRKATL